MGIRGLFFRIKQNEDCFLNKLCPAINYKEFFWHNVSSQSEVWSFPREKDFLTREYYKGSLLKRRIKRRHRILFLKLQAYYEEGKYLNLSTYEDYMDSPCCLIILVWDCEFVQVYSKDETFIKKLYDVVQKLGYTDITFVTDENDRRKRMDIR